MSVLKGLSEAGYNIWNVNVETKAPTWGSGWNKEHTTEEYQSRYDVNAKGSGIYAGKQANGEYVLMLDFDCCGTTHIINGCEDTVKRLAEFKNILNGNLAGSFSASTNGNANWLIQYTDCPDLINKIATLGCKIEYESLEICLKWNCVLPPTMTKCKISGKFDTPRKWIDESQPFLNLSVGDAPYNWIMNLVDGKLKAKPIPIQKPIPRSVTPPSSEEETEIVMTAYDDMILNGIGKKRLPINDYLRLASVLKSNNVSYDIWNKWNIQCCIVTDNHHIELWDKCVIDRNLKMSFVLGLSKREDPEYYKKYLKDKGMNEPDVMTAQTLKLGHRDVALVCSKKMDRLKYCNDLWYLCRENNNLWAVVKKPHSYIVKVIQDEINDLIAGVCEAIKNASDERRKVMEEERKELFKCYTIVAGTGYAPCVMNYLTEYLYEDKFNEKIDYNIGCMAFKNGILDLKTGLFRNGLLPSDYISFTLDFDYKKINVDENSFVWKQFKKVLNNNDEHLDYFMSLVGHSFTGESALVKAMYFMIDGSGDSKGDNGKSFLFKIFENVMGDYVGKPTSSLLEKNNPKVHKQIAGLKGKRFIYMEEFPQKAINCDLMKELGDGGKMNNEVMFGTMEKINIIGMFFALSNHTPKLDADESAGYNRYKEVSFKSHFDRTGNREEENEDELEYIADTGIGAKIVNEYRDEVIGLILKYAMRFYKSGIPTTPIAFLQAEQATKSSNDEFLDWFEDNCEKGLEGDNLAEKKIVDMSGVKADKVRKGMGRLGYKYKKDLSCGLGRDNNGKAYKGGYESVRLVE